MQLSTGNIVAIVSVITLIVAAAAVAGGQFRISRNTQIVSNYREAAQAWQLKSNALQDELNELRDDVQQKLAVIESQQKQIADAQSQITELRGHLQALQDMMVGGTALETLRTEITGARDQILAAIGGGGP